MPRNVAAGITLPKAPPRDQMPLTIEQAFTLIDAPASHRLGALVAVGLDTGARPGELFGLQWPDIDLDAGKIKFRRSLEERKGQLRLKELKTRSSRRTLPIMQTTIEALRLHRETAIAEGRDVKSGQLFTASRGGLLRVSNFGRIQFRPWTVAAGVPAIRVCDLRHTMATLLLQAGVNVKVVSERLGHTNITTTLQNYVHVMAGMQEAATATMAKLMNDSRTAHAARTAGQREEP